MRRENLTCPAGVNFMEKTISVRRTTITFSIWDLGGQREFVNMLPLVCNDAVAILFMFDLSRKSTLNSVKEWYRQARGFNKVRPSVVLLHAPTSDVVFQTAIPFLIGTKYDQFATLPRDEQEEITKQVRPVNIVMMLALIIPLGEAVRKSHARFLDLLFNIRFDKCAKDLQDSTREGVRSQMRHTRNRRCRRAHPDIRRRIRDISPWTAHVGSGYGGRSRAASQSQHRGAVRPSECSITDQGMCLYGRT